MSRRSSSTPRKVSPRYHIVLSCPNHRAASCHELASYYAEQLLEKYPDEKDGWVAYLEANNGTCGDDWYENHFEVISFFEKFLEKNPGNYQGLYAIIENLLADNRYEEAVPYIEQIKSAKKNHQYLCSMAQIHEQQKQYALAINDYERIIDCLKEDYHVKKGEQLDWYLRKIERLRHIA